MDLGVASNGRVTVTRSSQEGPARAEGARAAAVAEADESAAGSERSPLKTEIIRSMMGRTLLAQVFVETSSLTRCACVFGNCGAKGTWCTFVSFVNYSR